VWLFYEFYARTLVGGKWLCVVVKYASDDAFMITAYLTDQLKAGETIWPAHDAVMERVDEQGHVLGFSVLGVSRFKKDHPLEAELMTGT
jgi:hypothetical protein